MHDQSSTNNLMLISYYRINMKIQLLSKYSIMIWQFLKAQQCIGKKSTLEL